jgi:hypothetical protein
MWVFSRDFRRHATLYSTTVHDCGTMRVIRQCTTTVLRYLGHDGRHRNTESFQFADYRAFLASGVEGNSLIRFWVYCMIQRQIAGTCAPVLLGELITVVGACSSTLP